MERRILENISLKKFNTFGIEASARYFFTANTLDDLQWLRQQPEFDQRKLWLGGGSNILLTGNFDGLVIKIDLRGKQVLREGEEKVEVSSAAGENWHEFVQYTLDHNWGGLENLSLIPGNVGTAPMQNIGAYGVELKDSMLRLEALELETGALKTFENADCQFDYRQSVFKKELKDRYIITEVVFELSSQSHTLHTEYGAISGELERQDLEPSIHNISKVVTEIRRSKLPNPKEIGNSGSFFKNPIVPAKKHEQLKGEFPDLPSYALNEHEVKIPAGWMIEQCGWKGFREGDAGVHQKQALVLVNYGNATGTQIYELANRVRQSVVRKFAIELEAEVNLI